MYFYECSPGVATLGERNVENSKKTGEITGELEKLRHVKEGHHKNLADLQREARAHANYSADLQVKHRYWQIQWKDREIGKCFSVVWLVCYDVSSYYRR